MSLHQDLQRVYENYYNNRESPHRVKDEGIVTSSYESLLKLSSLRGSRYAGVSTTMYVSLDRLGFFNDINDNGIDAIEGVEICTNNVSSVSLYIGVPYYPTKPINEASRLFKYIERSHKVRYHPIKTIYNPVRGQIVKFFKSPLLLCAERDVTFSIRVTYRQEEPVKIIGLRMVLYKTPIKKNIVKNYSLRDIKKNRNYDRVSRW